MENLKPCPFCGSKEISAWYRGTRYGRIAFIECDTCGATSKTFRYYDDNKEFNENDIGAEKAVAAWNRRAIGKDEYRKIIETLRMIQDPEIYEPQITEETFEVLELAIKIIEAMENDKNV